MILFLYGKDTYRLQEKLKAIKVQYKKVHQSGLNLEQLDACQLDFREFWDKLFQQSIFIKKKLFFLENIFSNEQFKNSFLKRINEILNSQNIVVVFEKKEPSKADKLFQGLKKQAKCQNFAILTGEKLKAWVQGGFIKHGAKIDLIALDKLIDFVGPNLWQMSQEIKKLATYKLRDLVTSQDIDLFVKPKIDAEIFKTIDSLAQKDKKTALQMVQQHLEKGDSPFYILSMIAYQFRNLLLVKSGKKTGFHPFVLKKTTALAARFPLSELKQSFNRVFQTDLAIKTGAIAPEQGLRMLIAKT